VSAVTNSDIQAAWHYHNGTKHPNGTLLDRWHFYDPRDQPPLFKVYTGLEPVPLPLDTTPRGIPALAAISTHGLPAGDERLPDIAALARILYFSAGITKYIKYPPPWGEVPFRAAACTGALYHIELYLVCGPLPGLEAGVYHFDPMGLALRRLRQGDYRGLLVGASGDEPGIAHAPAVLVYTDVFWRNAIKYQAREYRHAFWDSGTILANTLAISSVHDMPARVVAGFVDVWVSRLLGLEAQPELPLVLVPLGYTPDAIAPSASEVPPLRLKTGPASDYGRDYPAIRAMHAASALMDEEEVVAWRGQVPPRALPAPSGPLFPLQPDSDDAMSPDPLEPVIMRRGSTRRFARVPITFRELSTLLERALRGVPADFLQPAGAMLNHAYLIVNAVDGLEPGAYVFHRDRQALELLKAGNCRGTAGHLALGQDLAADASVDVFFLADLKPILERWGNRGYRAAQLDASIAAGRLYLAAYAQRLGATGLTFYDDAVTDFFSPHARGKSVMFLIALGRKAQRR